MAQSWSHLPFSACWSRWRLSVTLSTPWRTRRDEEGGWQAVWGMTERGGSLIATGKWGVVMREQGGRQGTQLEMLGA